MASLSSCRQSIRDLVKLRRRGCSEHDGSLQLLDSLSASLAEAFPDNRTDVAGHKVKPRPTLRIDTDKVNLHYGRQHALDDEDIEPLAPKRSSKPWADVACKEVKSRAIAHSLPRCCSLPPLKQKTKSFDSSSSASRKVRREATLGSLRNIPKLRSSSSSSIITSGLKMSQSLFPVTSCIMVQQKLDDVFVSMLTDMKMKVSPKAKWSTSEMNLRFNMR